MLYIKNRLMNVKSFFAIVMVGLIGAIGSSGCVKSNTPPSNPNSYTITSIINTTSFAVILDSALYRTQLDTLFNNYSSFTYFLTTDQEFSDAGITLTTIQNMPDSQIAKIVLYGAIAGQYTFTQLPVGPNAPMTTLSGDSIFITSNGSGVFVNGYQLASQNTLASNGEMFVVGKALLPPAGNFIQIATADTSLSYFVAAVARASMGDFNINTILSSGVYTVFMPTNAAFQAAGFTTIDEVNNAPSDSLAEILEYHILPKRAFTSDFVSQQSQATLLSGKSITWGLLGGTAYGVEGAGNSGIIAITTPNIMAHNGVIHIIAGMLKP
jgi:transforming growth factor-beta-induced protein